MTIADIEVEYFDGSSNKTTILCISVFYCWCEFAVTAASQPMRLQSTRLSTEESLGEGPETEYCVLGGGHVGAALAQRLHDDGHAVTVVDETCDTAAYVTVRGDPANLEHLKTAGLGPDSTVVVATPRDGRNLLLAQLVRAHFGSERVVVRVNDPDRHELVSEAGHEPFCATTVLSTAIADGLSRREPRHTA